MFDGTNVTAYVDGVVASAPAPGTAQYAADRLLIGCDIDIGAPMQHFTGSIDDVRLYDRALAPGEIASLAAM